MKKHILLAAIAASFILTSCSQKIFYQVYKAETPGLIEEGNSLIFENEDCKISYNLWAEGGNGTFIMYNKTNKDLFVILPQSFMIKNGIALDYFKNRETKETTSTYLNVQRGNNVNASVSGLALTIGGWYPATVSAGLSKGASKGSSQSSTIIFKEQPIVCIPPHASKTLGEYKLLSKLIRICEKSQAYPKASSVPLIYERDNSPLRLTNRIAYSFDKDGNDIKYIENEMWISELTNYSHKSATEEKEIKECEYDFAEPIDIFTIDSPDKFYNIYKGNRSYKNKK